jgi:DNA (cytosine-5)-methyltransferase 1
MNYLDLFHGIGGFALGAYNAGFRCENHYCSDIEPYAQELYKLRFQDSIQLGDITKINYKDLPNGEWIITGGFPCQDISVAGKGRGLIDEKTGEKTRSGLWYDYCTAISTLRPRYAIIENVPALITRGLDEVLCSLAEIGYDASWTTISAQEMGAPHKRERIWIVAHPNNNGPHVTKDGQGNSQRNDSNAPREDSVIEPKGRCLSWFTKNARCKHGEAWGEVSEWLQGQYPEWNSCDKPERSDKARNGSEATAGTTRMDDGLSTRVDRLKGCGNAIVPQIAELIFNLIKEIK